MSKYNDIEIQTAKNLLGEGYKRIARDLNGVLYASKSIGNELFYEAKDFCFCSQDVPIFESIDFGDEPTSLESIAYPQVLDEAERRYLSNVIRPFRDKVISICKTNYGGKYQYVCIALRGHNIDLPVFETGTMYKGMELNHAYTLEELGLIRKGEEA